MIILGTLPLLPFVLRPRSGQKNLEISARLALDRKRLTGPTLVLRGGSWDNDNPANLSASYRNNDHPENRNDNIGFRGVWVGASVRKVFHDTGEVRCGKCSCAVGAKRNDLTPAAAPLLGKRRGGGPWRVGVSNRKSRSAFALGLFDPTANHAGGATGNLDVIGNGCEWCGHWRDEQLKRLRMFRGRSRSAAEELLDCLHSPAKSPPHSRV